MTTVADPVCTASMHTWRRTICLIWPQLQRLEDHELVHPVHELRPEVRVYLCNVTAHDLQVVPSNDRESSAPKSTAHEHLDADSTQSNGH